MSNMPGEASFHPKNVKKRFLQKTYSVVASILIPTNFSDFSKLTKKLANF